MKNSIFINICNILNEIFLLKYFIRYRIRKSKMAILVYPFHPPCLKGRLVGKGDSLLSTGKNSSTVIGKNYKISKTSSY